MLINKISAVAIGALALTAVQADASTLLTYWNFNNTTPGSGGGPGVFNSTGSTEVYNSATDRIVGGTSGVYAATAYVDVSNLLGTPGGSANNNWGNFAGTTINALGGDVSGGALAVIGNGNNGHYVDFVVSMADYIDPVISFATRGTGTGYNSGTWSWSTDGSTFTNLVGASTASQSTSFGAASVDFSSVAGLNNAATAYFRYTLNGATGTSGNNRIDNFQINATHSPIPEPASLGLLAVGTLSMLRRRRSI